MLQRLQDKYKMQNQYRSKFLIEQQKERECELQVSIVGTSVSH